MSKTFKILFIIDMLLILVGYFVDQMHYGDFGFPMLIGGFCILLVTLLISRRARKELTVTDMPTFPTEAVATPEPHRQRPVSRILQLGIRAGMLCVVLSCFLLKRHIHSARYMMIAGLSIIVTFFIAMLARLMNNRTANSPHPYMTISIVLGAIVCMVGLAMKIMRIDFAIYIIAAGLAITTVVFLAMFVAIISGKKVQPPINIETEETDLRKRGNNKYVAAGFTLGAVVTMVGLMLKILHLPAGTYLVRAGIVITFGCLAILAFLIPARNTPLKK